MPPLKAYVYLKGDEFICCKTPEGEVPRVIRVGLVDPQAPGVQTLMGPYDTPQAAVEALCRGRDIFWSPAPWAKNYSRVEGKYVANLPCPRPR